MKTEIYKLPKGLKREKANIVRLNKKDTKALPHDVRYAVTLGQMRVHAGEIYGWSVDHILGREPF